MRMTYFLTSLIIIGCILLTLLSNVLAEEPSFSAGKIMELVDGRYDGEAQETDMTMVLIDKRGNKRIRQLKTFRKDDGKDSRNIIFFLKPADVRDTAYLSYDWDASEKEDDAWLYLPALRKVKRIAGSDESGAFMGSDFSYADINGLEIDDWQYRFAGDNQQVDGFETWVIDGIPKSDRHQTVVEETGYLKIRMWIRRDNYMIVKGQYWIKKGKKVKYFRAKEIRETQGIWTAYEMYMVTTVNGKKEHASIIKTGRAVYDNDLPETLFTTQRMERGL